MRAPVPGTVVEAGLSKGPFRAPRGTQISCKGWQQEAALRMLLNNLDPEVAEIGRASCRERGEISVVAVSLKKKKRRGVERRAECLMRRMVTELCRLER